MTPFITLNAEDAFAAVSVATVQIVRKVAASRNSDHGAVSVRGMKMRFADGIHGCMAELAASRMMNVAWTPGGVRVSRGDVAAKWEVRGTEYESGHLLVYESDDDDATFILMVGNYPIFRMAGGIVARDAKQKKFWNENADPPCYWVPQASLAIDWRDIVSGSVRVRAEAAE